MAIVININSVDKTSIIRKDSLNISDTLNARNMCAFNIYDTTGTYRPSIGQVVDVTLDGTKIFAGTIDSLTERKIKGTSTTLFYNVICVDYNQLCDRYTVAQVYESKTLEYIVKDIVDNFLTGESITYTNVPTGTPTITKAVFTYTTVTAAFDELSDLTGYDWYIDYNKDLHFFDRSTNLASTDLSDAEANIQEMTIKRTRNQYRNRQYLRAGFDVTSERTEYFVGNTKLTTFTTQYPIAKEPSATQYAYVADDTTEAGTTTTNITATAHGLVTGDLITNTTRENAIRTVTKVDDDNLTVATVTGQTTGDTIKKYTGTTKTIGIRELETGYDWYWNKSSNEFTQDDDSTLLTSNDVLGVTYQGFYPIIARSDDEIEIADRASTEGGNGIYETIDEDRSIESQETAKEKAEGLLRRYGTIPERINILTFTSGYAAGQLVDINVSEHAVNDSYLIQSVKIREYGTTYIYQIEALSGENIGGWVKFFKDLSKRSQKYVIRENEVLLRILSLSDSLTLSESLTFPADTELSDSITLAESLTPTDATPENRVDFAQVNYSEVGP